MSGPRIRRGRALGIGRSRFELPAKPLKTTEKPDRETQADPLDEETTNLGEQGRVSPEAGNATASGTHPSNEEDTRHAGDYEPPSSSPSPQPKQPSWIRSAGPVILVILAVLLVRPAEVIWEPLVEDARDAFGSRVDVDDPLEISHSTWIDGPSTSLEYALAGLPSSAEHVLLQDSSLPGDATPIGARSDILALQGPDVDEKLSLVGVSAAGMRVSDVLAGTRIAIFSGRGDSFPRSYTVILDLISGESRGFDSKQILDNGSAPLPRGDSVLLIVNVDAPESKTYEWVVRLDLAAESGELISTYVDANGNTHTSRSSAMRHPFRVTGVAEEYSTTYDRDADFKIRWSMTPSAP